VQGTRPAETIAQAMYHDLASGLAVLCTCACHIVGIGAGNKQGTVKSRVFDAILNTVFTFRDFIVAFAGFCAHGRATQRNLICADECAACIKTEPMPVFFYLSVPDQPGRPAPAGAQDQVRAGLAFPLLHGWRLFS